MVALIWANVKIDSPSGPAKIVGNPKGVDNSTRENRKVVVFPASFPWPRAPPLWSQHLLPTQWPCSEPSLPQLWLCPVATSWGVPYLNSLQDCPVGTGDKNLPAKAGDMGSIPGPGRVPMPGGNEAHVLELLKPSCPRS